MGVEVTFFRFGIINLVPDPVCRTDIEGGRLRMSSVLRGQPGQDANVPPNAQPDAAAVLVGQGWFPRLSRRDSARGDDGRALPQPAAMAKAGAFASLSVDFSTNGFCRCRDVANLCKKTRVRLSVDYNGTVHPTVEAFKSEERDCTAADADPINALRPTKWEGQRQAGDDNTRPAEPAWVQDVMGHLPAEQQRTHVRRLEDTAARAHRDTVGTHNRFIFFYVRQTCPCTWPLPRPPGEERPNFWEEFVGYPLFPEPCDLQIEVEYNYRVVP